MAYQPKSYRKFVATAATATLVASAVTPVFAAETGAAATFTDVPPRYVEAVDYLLTNQITNGISDTEFGTTLSIKRVDAAVMIAKALKLDLSNRPASGFGDVPERAAVYVDALKEEGYINGKTATSFGAADTITRGEVALIFANAFKLTGTASHTFTDVAPRYDAAVKALVAAGITGGKTTTSFGTADAITRGEFAIFLHRAGTPDGVVAPKVAAVSVVDAETVQVSFTSAVDEDSAETVANYSVNGAAPAEATLSADGKTVTLTVEAEDRFAVDTQVSVVVDKEIQTLAGEDFSTVDYTTNVLFSDEVNPTVSAVSTPNGALRVTFSEKIEEPADDSEINIVVNGQSITLGSSRATWVTDNVVLIPKGTLDNEFDLTAGTTYSIAVAGAQDLVGNPMDLYVSNFVYRTVTDTTAPTVASVTAEGEAAVNVKFSEEISEEVAAPTFLVKRNGVTLSTNAPATTTDGVTYELDLSAVDFADLYPGTENTASLEITVSGARDLGNNLLATVTKSVTLKEDTVKPTLSKTAYDTTDDVAVLTFSEDIVAGTGTVTVINNATSQVVSGTSATVVGDNTVEISGLTANGSYSVRVPAGFVEDTSQAANANAAFTTNVTVNATVADVVVADAYSNEDVLTVVFSDEVTGGTGSTSAANPANYRLDGKALPAGTVITLDSDSNEATITLPEGSIESSRTAILTVSNVKAADGSTVPTTSRLVYVDDTKAPVLTSAKVDGTELVLTFSEDVDASTFDSADFNTLVNGVDVAETVVAGDEDNQLVITTTQASFATGTITVEVDADADGTDIQGNEVVTGTVVTATR